MTAVQCASRSSICTPIEFDSLVHKRRPERDFHLQVYFQRLENLGVPGETRDLRGGNGETPLYYSNEFLTKKSLDNSQAGIWKCGGTLITTGVGMTLELAYAMDADEIYVIENDARVNKIFWPILITYFATARSRIEFIEFFIAEKFTEEEHVTLAGKSLVEIAQYALRSDRMEDFPDRLELQAEAVSQWLRPYLMDDCEENIKEIVKGLAIGTLHCIQQQVDPSAQARLPIEYSTPVVVSGMPFYGKGEHSFLYDQHSFEQIHKKVLEGRFTPISGSLFGEGLRKCVDLLERRGQKPRVMYVDNVPRINSWNGELENYKSHFQCLERIHAISEQEMAYVHSSKIEGFDYHHAYSLSSEDLQSICFLKLFGDDSSECDDIPGILHSQFLERFSNFQYPLAAAGQLDALDQVFDLDVVYSPQWSRTRNCIHLLKTNIAHTDIVFSDEKELWDYIDSYKDQHSERKSIDKSMATSETIDPFHRRMINRALHEMGFIRRLLK